MNSMSIDWAQLINWIVAGAITAIFLLIGFLVQKKYEQRKKEEERKKLQRKKRRMPPRKRETDYYESFMAVATSPQEQ